VTGGESGDAPYHRGACGALAGPVESGDGESAFVACEEAVRLLLGCQDSDPYWIKLFLAVFGVVWYLSSMAYFRRAPNVRNYEAPKQGRFLGLDDVDTKTFVPAQKAFVRIKMAMFAEGVGKTAAAGKWAVEALGVADEIAGAKTIYSLAWLDIAPEIVQDNYSEAVRMALVMADSRSPGAAALEEDGFKEPGERQRIQELLEDPRKETMGMMLLAVSLVCRLATLQLKGASTEEISTGIESVSSSRSGDLRIEKISKALREALLGLFLTEQVLALYELNCALNDRKTP
jgi:hypothetical protein